MLEIAVPIPADLADRVSEAQAALFRHPDQTLPSWYRYAIYEAILAERSQASYAARAWIDVLSARHVQFCWQPYQRSGWAATWLQPADLISSAEQALHDTADPAVVQRQIARAEALADMVGAPAASAQYPAWCVFEAALRALQSAWACHTYTATPVAPNHAGARAAGLDDASWYAAIAIAADRPASYANPQARTTQPDRAFAPADAAAQLRWTFFWEWWLHEAIPQALLIAHSSPAL